MKDARLDRLDVMALEILEETQEPIPFLTRRTPRGNQDGPDGLDRALYARAATREDTASFIPGTPVMERFERLLEGGFVKEIPADKDSGLSEGVTLGENGTKLLTVWRKRGIPGVAMETKAPPPPPPPSRGGRRKAAPTPEETPTV